MKEKDYIDATNHCKASAALELLGDLIFTKEAEEQEAVKLRKQLSDFCVKLHEKIKIDS